MAPLPHNNTAIFYLDYQTCGHDHTMEVRFGSGSSAGEAAAMIDAFLIALDDYIRVWTVIGARVQDIGTNVSYPVTWDGEDTYGSGAGTEDESAQYLSYVGRSIDGRRYRQFAFGSAVDHSSGKYRVQAGVDAKVAAALAVLEAAAECPVSISGQAINFQQYANCGQNSYWERQIR